MMVSASGPDPAYSLEWLSQGCHYPEPIVGRATHVGYGYPWQEVWENRKAGRAARGSITQDQPLPNRPYMVALRAVMDDHSLLGKWVRIISIDPTGGLYGGLEPEIFALVVDAMSAELGGPGSYGWVPGVNYEGRVVDLDPEGMFLLAGDLRGGLDVRVILPGRC